MMTVQVRFTWSREDREGQTERKGEIAMSCTFARRNTKADERKTLSILSSRGSRSFRGGRTMLQILQERHQRVHDWEK